VPNSHNLTNATDSREGTYPRRRQRDLGRLTPVEYETIMKPPVELAA
jgi:hypothetical protein